MTLLGGLAILFAPLLFFSFWWARRHEGRPPRRATSVWRGHKIIEINGDWFYIDNGKAVWDSPTRPCGHCGLANTPEGYDGCIAEIPGAMNACCGHGETSMAYVQLKGGRGIYADDALPTINCARLMQPEQLPRKTGDSPWK